MLLSHKTMIKLNKTEENIIGHMCYAAYKLWNICNYERLHYKELGMDKYPDWYYQKSHHKDDMWFKSLPSQTAQEVCKLLDKSWRSFYVLRKTGGITNPRPPRFKHGGTAITYMQNGIKHDTGSTKIRLSIPKQLKEYMRTAFDISDKYLFLENKVFRNTDLIKQIRIYPPKSGRAEVIVIYEVDDPVQMPDNGHYLSIDIGLHNLLTCYDSKGRSFVLGRDYLSICRRYDKEIARVQGQWAAAQARSGIRYPKSSKHVLRLYEKRRNSIKDYLHKITRELTEYCRKNKINTVIIGDIRNIRKEKDLGNKANQKLHALPYEKIYTMLGYKLALCGIRLKKQEESYTSQCPPDAKYVGRENARKSNRKERGLYTDGKIIYNADAVGAYNIMKKYFAVTGIRKEMPVSRLSDTKIIKVAV